MAIDHSRPVVVVNVVASMVDIMTSLLRKLGFSHVDVTMNGAQDEDFRDVGALMHDPEK